MKTIVLLSCLLLFIYTTVAIDITYTGNITVKADGKDDFDYRKTNCDVWSILNYNGAFFSSVSVAGTSKSIEGDAVWGAAYTAPGDIPLAWIAYWNATVDYASGTDFSSLDVSSAASYIASAYVSLTEKDSTGALVKTQSLKQSTFGLTMDWNLGGAQSNNHLKWVTFLGGVNGLPWQINLTFVVSDVVGVINGGAVVSPKSLESIVSISNWPYQLSSNTLSLDMAVATGATNTQGSTVVSGGGQQEVFFSVSEKAMINGSPSSVSVSGFVDTDFDSSFGDANLKAQLDSIYKTSATIKVVSVTFPAGAAHILYDPSVGAGPSVAQYQTNTAAATTASAFVAFVMVLLVLL